jgi:hypothetical protein
MGAKLMIGLGKLPFLRPCAPCPHGSGDFGGFSAALPLPIDRAFSNAAAAQRGIGVVRT